MAACEVGSGGEVVEVVGRDIAVSFPALTADEQAAFARELGQDLIRDGVDASGVRIARSDAEAMDLGGLVIIAAGALGWEFLTSAAKGAGEAVGREAGRDAYGYVRRKVEDLCRRRRIRADVTARGHTWVLGGEYDRADPAPDLTVLGGRAGTLGVVILGASRFPYCDGLDNPAFARSAVAARDLFAAPGPVFARTAVLDLFDSQAHPGEIVEAIERHIDAHPDMTDVLIYYCGHGSFTRDRTYFLTLGGTRLGREASTGLKLKDLRHDLETRLADRRLYVVLDCCFAGEAAKEFMGASVDQAVEAAIHEALPPGGWLVLAASSASSVAMAPAGHNLTMFTGALVDVLRRASRPLSLDQITVETRRAILAAHGGRAVLPECHAPRQSGGDLRRVPVFGGLAAAVRVASPRPAPVPTPAERRPVEAPAAGTGPKQEAGIAGLSAGPEAAKAAPGTRWTVWVGGLALALGGILLAQYSIEHGFFGPAAAPLSAREEPLLKPKAEFRECADCPAMVVIPAGSFTMGSPATATDRESDEGPQRTVRIGKVFAVGKFTVSFAEWDACVSGGGCNGYRPEDRGWGRGKMPVINVSWTDAKAYVAWISKVTGKSYRLLTEAEWEYAARAGTTTPFWWGSSISPSQANYNGNFTYGNGSEGEYRGRTVAVDRFSANPFWLYQMHGNVWQWVEDCYVDNYRATPADGSAQTTQGCSIRVLRGGSWGSYPRSLRAAYRLRNTPDDRLDFNGFRVARTLTH